MRFIKLVLLVAFVFAIAGCQAPIEGKCKVCDFFGFCRPDPDGVHPDKPDPVEKWDKSWKSSWDKEKK